MANVALAEEIDGSLANLRYRIFGDDVKPAGPPSDKGPAPLQQAIGYTHAMLCQALEQLRAIQERL